MIHKDFLKAFVWWCGLFGPACPATSIGGWFILLSWNVGVRQAHGRTGSPETDEMDRSLEPCYTPKG